MNKTSQSKRVLPLALLLLVGASGLRAEEAADLAPTPLAAGLGLRKSDLALRKGAAHQVNPAAEAGQALRTVDVALSTSGVSDMVGTLSIQNFQGTQGNLSQTHASADGFRNYFTTWYTPNFLYRDGTVGTWAYHDVAGGDNWDLWTSGGTDYGIDGVRACWHSGHGGTWSTNVFFAPMGQNWAGRGWNAFSNSMTLGGNAGRTGDERLRYMFWDTCLSVRVSGGNDPYATWGTRARGVRMVFGYETVSVDDSRYGSYFWEEWNKGKSLSTAFLDASWRISTGQSPAVVAFGANQAEATDRLNNERFMTNASAASNWGQWRWYYARAAAAGRSVEALVAGQGAQTRGVVPQGASDAEMLRFAQVLGLQGAGPEAIEDRPFGLRVIRAEGATLVFERNGNLELSLEPTQAQARRVGPEPTDEELRLKAEDLAGQLGLAEGLQLRAGTVRELHEQGGARSTKSSSRVVEKTLVLDQVQDGLPFIDPEAGHLEVTFEAASGRPTRIRSTLRKLGPAAASDGADVRRRSLEEARSEALRQLPTQVRPGASKQGPVLVPGSESVGYQLVEGRAVPVYRVQLLPSAGSTSRPTQVVVPLVLE